MSSFESRHVYFYFIFLFCVAIGLANLVHHLLFRFTRLKKSETSVSNRDMGFELCCVVRERMLAWVRRNYPAAFPVTRFQMLPEENSRGTEEAVIRSR